MSISPMIIAAIQQLATIDFESWAKESFEITTRSLLNATGHGLGFRGVGIWIAR
jgi:hypothetical protein